MNFNPLTVTILILVALGLFFGSPPRTVSRSESFAGCAMPSHPSQSQIDDCHDWQREKHHD